jgi:hypothetical protein
MELSTKRHKRTAEIMVWQLQISNAGLSGESSGKNMSIRFIGRRLCIMGSKGKVD